VGLLALSKVLENMEVGHNVMHGQYDWTNDPALDLGRALTSAKGSAHPYRDRRLGPVTAHGVRRSVALLPVARAGHCLVPAVRVEPVQELRTDERLAFRRRRPTWRGRPWRPWPRSCWQWPRAKELRMTHPVLPSVAALLSSDDSLLEQELRLAAVRRQAAVVRALMDQVERLGSGPECAPLAQMVDGMERRTRSVHVAQAPAPVWPASSRSAEPGE
jgi:hypothetical protein